MVILGPGWLKWDRKANAGPVLETLVRQRQLWWDREDKSLFNGGVRSSGGSGLAGHWFSSHQHEKV